jgi:prepilin-type processing-associated H-X9-DG protein
MPNIAPINSPTNPSSAEPIDQQLQPYMKNDGIWACPDDSTSFTTGGGTPFWNGNFDGTSNSSKFRHRTYSYATTIYTKQGGATPDTNTGMCVWDSGIPSTGSTPHVLAAIDQPSSTVALVETANGYTSSDEGSPWGSVFGNCDTYKLAGRTVSDTTGAPPSCVGSYGPGYIPYIGHATMGNYVFADGHAKAMHWGDVRHNDFDIFKLTKQAPNAYTP